MLNEVRSDVSGGTKAPRFSSLPDERTLRARDRVLLYVRGMDLPPAQGLELARESLIRAGEPVDEGRIMEILRTLLEERGLAHVLWNEDGERQLSAPPMNRHPMIAEELGRHSLLHGLKLFFSGNAPSPKER